MSSPGVDPGTFQCHAAALTTWPSLLCIFSISYGTYFPNMFISVHICLYTCICVCMCAFTVYTPNQGVYDPYRSLYGLGARSWGQRRRLLAVGNWYLQYEQIWARYVYERICLYLWNLWRIYIQIQTDINAFKQPKWFFFWGKCSYDVHISSIYGLYLFVSRLNDVYMFK
jgi:hypothetical protein